MEKLRDRKVERKIQSENDKKFHELNRKHNLSIATARVGKIFLINGIARQSTKGTIFKFKK